MEWFGAAALFAVGIALIVKGGDIFVDASGWVSDVSGIPRAVIGATLVSFATTAPEYFVSLIAVLKGAYDLSVGNAVGSLLCNLGIAFALLALCRPGQIDDRRFGLKGLIMIAAAAALWLTGLGGVLSVGDGIILLLVFALFTCVNIRDAGPDGNGNDKKPTHRREIILNIAKFVGGIAAILWGADLIVDNGRTLAALLGVSEAVIGLTVVAIGTSLPEIVTSISALIKKESALSLGNIFGANVLDATLILATGAFVSGGRLSVSPSTLRVDLPAALLLMTFAVLPAALKRKTYRWQGACLAGLYTAYLLWVTLAS